MFHTATAWRFRSTRNGAPVALLWLTLLAAAGIAGPAFGQFSSCEAGDWVCGQKERDKEEEERRDKAHIEELSRIESERYEAQRGHAEELRALRAHLLTTPSLPPDRNPLLGRWRLASHPQPAGEDDLSRLLGMLADPSVITCGIVFGESLTTEFLPGSWAGIYTTGPLRYRMADNLVYALPDQDIPLLGFEIVDRNTIREVAHTPGCVLSRIGAAPSSVPSQAPASGRSALPATVDTGSPKSARPAVPGCSLLEVGLGTDTVESVQRDIARRGGSPMSNINSGRLTLNALSGDYADAGGAVMAVNYTFDASDPSSRLIGLTIVNSTHSDAEFQKVLAARQAAAAAVIGPLRKASATEFQGAGSGCSLRLVPNDGSWFIYEIYELKR